MGLRAYALTDDSVAAATLPALAAAYLAKAFGYASLLWPFWATPSAQFSLRAILCITVYFSPLLCDVIASDSVGDDGWNAADFVILI